MIAENNEDGTITVTGYCRIAKELYSVTVPSKGYFFWQKGEHIQNALPDVSIEDREFLISGLSPKGWNLMFNQNEEA